MVTNGEHNQFEDRSDRYCVVGAGAAGLTAAKNLREHGFAVDAYEAFTEVGGNWNIDNPISRVAESTHFISSKPFSAYDDFPMPDAFPDYPHHRQLLDYLRRYAEHFGLYEVIEFSTPVRSVEPFEDGKAWDVTIEREAQEPATYRYAGVLVANGHNWVPKWPSYPGQDDFAGEVIHAASYKEPSVLRGRRVLVVGAGNTGCDIAVESAQNAAETVQSVRRGYWYVDKYPWGKPADQTSDLVYALRLPHRINQFLFELTVKLTSGHPARHGLRPPDHRILETHPIVNSHLLYYVGHGEIDQRGDIDRFEPDRVVFKDGGDYRPDLVIFCTGYLYDTPFLDPAHLNWRDGRPHLYRLTFPPDYDNLFTIGLIQGDSGLFNLMHWQAVAAARYLLVQRQAPTRAAEFAQRVRTHLDEDFGGGVRYAESTRHYFEANHRRYLEALADDIDFLSEPLRPAVGRR